MKLLYDQNLSPRLVLHRSDLYPDSEHVYTAGLDQASDAVLWEYARKNDLTLVIKDADFSEIVEVLGFPTKVIWIRLENCSTRQIESILRQHHEAIAACQGGQRSHSRAGLSSHWLIPFGKEDM